MKAKHVFLTMGLALAMALGVGAAIGANRPVRAAEAYGNSDTTWFIAHEENSWSKNDPADHLTYRGMQGENYEYVSDNWISLKANEKFNIVYSWNDGADYNTFTPNLMNDQSLETVFTVGGLDDFAVATRDITVKFFFQFWGEGAAWHGLYWQEKPTTYDVHVVVNEVERGVEEIEENALPEEPTLTFAKEFSGWFSDPEYHTPVTGITSDTTVYGYTYNAPGWTYNIDLSDVSTTFAHPYVYMYDAHGEKSAFPGEDFNPAYSLVVPTTATFVISNGSAIAQTVDIEQTRIANDTLKVLNDRDGSDKYLVRWASSVDEPAEEGYYICGLVNWKYATATKMTNTSWHGNVAFYMNLSINAGQSIRVRSYYTDRTPYDQWATLDTGSCGYGDPDDENFVISVDGEYDIYAFYDADVFKYSVAEHTDSYAITMTGVKFEGKNKDTTVSLYDQRAYNGDDFVPEEPGLSGYATRGVFTDENCTTEYVATKFNAPGHLYIKYTKYGFYLTGDDVFSGGTGHGWNVDYATPISGSGSNILEGAVTILGGVDPEVPDNPVSVKPLEYVEDDGSGNPGWASIGYTMGHESDPDFVSIDGGGNFVFTKAGTFAFYVNSEYKVWFNGGEYAFHAKFLSEVGGECHYDGTTNLDNLKSIWVDQKVAYSKLSVDEKEHVEGFTFNGGDPESSDACLRMIALYHYIVWKYGSADFEDFIWGQYYEPHSFNVSPIVMNNNAMIICLISSAALLTSIGVTILVLKKKKHQ